MSGLCFCAGYWKTFEPAGSGTTKTFSTESRRFRKSKSGCPHSDLLLRRPPNEDLIEIEELARPDLQVIVGHLRRSCLSQEDHDLLNVFFFGHARSYQLLVSSKAEGSCGNVTIPRRAFTLTKSYSSPMSRTTIRFTISLPPAMAAKVEALQKEEHRTRSELVREALRCYVASVGRRRSLSA